MEETIKRNDKGEMLVSSQELKNIFDIGQTTLNKWGKAGCPKEGRDLWNLRNVIRWRGLAKVGDNNNDQSDEARKLQADADYKHAKARQEEVRLQEMLGNLVPIEMIKDKWAMSFTEIRQTLLKLPNDIRVSVHTQFPECSEGVTEIAEEVVRKCLYGLATSCNAGVGGTLERTDRAESTDGTNAI